MIKDKVITDLPILLSEAASSIRAGAEWWGDKVKISFVVDGKKMFRDAIQSIHFKNGTAYKLLIS